MTTAQLQDRMKELESLVQTYGWVVILKKYQKKDQPDYDTYIGKGKFEEIVEDMKASGANLLIIGNILKPSQIYRINEYLRPIKAHARDRVDLILKIFDKHAEGTEARMQIELASIKHMGPRIYGMGMELSRQWGGSKLARGIGETNTERMKRHLKEKVLKIEKNLKEYERMRMLHRESRKRKALPTVGLVGYTNVGKTSLLNLLTNKQAHAEDKLFATLGTHVGKLYMMTDSVMGIGKEVLFNDTIWFIRDLPPKLIKAFSSTLEDSIESDILLHVIDASDSFMEEKIQVVNKILHSIGANQKQIMVFNKIDKIPTDQVSKLQEQYKNESTARISVHEQLGIEALKDIIIQQLSL
jgi:GTPase